MPLGPDDPLWQRIPELRRICARESKLLAHLYFSRREEYFEASRSDYENGGPWRLKATPAHGVHQPKRPTLNFFAADDAWVTAYADAAANRGIRHGILLRRAALGALARRPGYELADVRVGHPKAYGVEDERDFWQFDIGAHRYPALHAMKDALVVRLATPDADEARYVDVPADAVVTVW